MAEPIRPRGHFAVAVSGYKLRLSKTFHVFPAEGGGTVTVPDTLLPATQHEPGSMRWWEDLWVVGVNPRERLCKFPGSKPYRQFALFDDAITYAAARQRRFKQQAHHVIFICSDETNRPSSHLVRTEEEVASIEEAIAAARTELELLQSLAQKERRETQPYLEVLRAHFSRSRAWALSDFLNEIAVKGADTVKASMPSSSWYRAKKDLAQAGLDLSGKRSC